MSIWLHDMRDRFETAHPSDPSRTISHTTDEGRFGCAPRAQCQGGLIDLRRAMVGREGEQPEVVVVMALGMARTRAANRGEALANRSSLQGE
jgi:hypothetical protein